MQQPFSIKGMHCASCEVVIEDKLSSIPSIKRVSVSHTKARALIQTKDDVPISAADLTRACTGLGYVFTASHPTPSTTPLPTWMQFGGILVILLAIELILDRLGLLRLTPSAANPTSFTGIFAVGLVAAFSSCAAIVGGLLTAVSLKYAKQHPEATRARKFRPHILFNTGRLVGFTLLGALLGLLGEGFSISPTTNGFLIFAIGLIMIGFGVNLLGILPSNLPTPKPPKQLTRFIHRFTESEHPLVPFFLGASTFFLPCGFTQSMQLYALTLGSPRLAAATMLMFALGTLPALLGIGYVTSATKDKALRTFSKVAGALIFILGIANLQNASALLDWQLPTRTSPTTSLSAPTITGNLQKISMNVTSYGVYEPNTLTVVEGIPVEWTIHGANVMGCADTLVLQAFDVATTLRPGTNTVKFTPTQTGRYTFSCSMGMVRGTMIVIPQTP